MRNRNFKSNPYSSNGNYGNVNNLTNSDLPRMPITPSTFEGERVSVDQAEAKVAYNRIRSYDVTVDKIDLQIAGAAPIFGKKNKAEIFAWKSDIKANYTGSLNNLYAQDDFIAPALLQRQAEIKYAGLQVHNDDQSLLNNKAFRLWNSNTQRLIAELDAAVYRDLDFMKIQYGTSGQSTKVKDALSPQAALLWLYQEEIFAHLTTLVNYQYLVAILPKLAELYPRRAAACNYLQNKLKTTAYTAPAKSIMISLKRRFVDKLFYKEFVLPCSVISQEFDGINSPLEAILLKQNIPSLSFSADSNTTQYFINTYALTQLNLSSNPIVTRDLDAFNIDTILALILSPEQDADLQTSVLDTYLATALKSIRLSQGALEDFGNNPIVMATETALAKLAVAPGASFNWTQNIDFGNISNVKEFSFWELTNQIVNFSASEPQYNDNGYTITVPMFRRTGMSKQMMLEYYQVFYMQSDDYISFLDISDRLIVRLRNKILVELELAASTERSVFLLSKIKQPENKPMTDTAALMAAFSDRLTAVSATYDESSENGHEIKLKPGSLEVTKQSVTIRNPDLMTWVTYSIVNRSAELEVWLTQNYVISFA